MFEIHENARINFNGKGESLISLIEEAPPEKIRDCEFSSDVHIKHHLTEKDIIDYHPETITNGFGENIGFFFLVLPV